MGAMNKGKKCGSGNLLFPNYATCIKNQVIPTKFENEWYVIFFQCRIKPASIRIPDEG